MFDVRPLAQPEVITKPGCVVTLTHTTESMHADPRRPDALVLRTMKGFLDENGNFIDYGDHQVQALDQKGLADMLADTTGGKPSGVFRTTDILPALQKQQAAKAAAEAAAKAAAEAAQAPKGPKAP